MSATSDPAPEDQSIMRKRQREARIACSERLLETPPAQSLIEGAGGSCWDMRLGSSADMLWTFLAGMCLYVLTV